VWPCTPPAGPRREVGQSTAARPLGIVGWRLALSAQEAAAAANCLGNERPLERRAPVFKRLSGQGGPFASEMTFWFTALSPANMRIFRRSRFSRRGPWDFPPSEVLETKCGACDTALAPSQVSPSMVESTATAGSRVSGELPHPRRDTIVARNSPVSASRPCLATQARFASGTLVSTLSGRQRQRPVCVNDDIGVADADQSVG
jgi:hypothetical protein